MHTSESLQKAFRYLFQDEVKALKELACLLPQNPTVINIGAGSGTSGLAFIESRPDLKLVTIDVQYDDSPFGCIVAEERVIREAGFPAIRYSFIVGDSKFIGKQWQEDYFYVGLPSMVLIDGDHSYEGCKGDIEAWLPNIKPGGIIAIHDYKKHLLTYDENTCPHPRPWPGVDRAVDELLLMGGYEMVMYVQSLIAFRVQ